MSGFMQVPWETVSPEALSVDVRNYTLSISSVTIYTTTITTIETSILMYSKNPYIKTTFGTVQKWS